MSHTSAGSLPYGPRRSRLPADLSRWEKLGLVLGLLLVLVFGGLVELRSAFLKRHMTDLQVYLRAGWAVRTGNDLYAVTDDNGWHYHYTPLFAILMAPFADPPPGHERAGAVPFAVSVGVWYALSLVCLAWAVHGLASAVEETHFQPGGRAWEKGSRTWWALRLIPVFACLTPIGQTLMRGQVNLVVLAVLCAMIAAVLRKKNFQSGCWLAVAICFKVIPAFLLLYPLWRRDRRCLLGCFLGLIVGIGFVPLAVFGPSKALGYYQEWTNVLVRPGLGAGADHSRAKELTDVTATDSQSWLAVLHNWQFPNRWTRPKQASSATRLAHWMIGGFMTGLTFLAAGWRKRNDPLGEVFLLGSLILVMLFLSPVCHLHYFCLGLPVVLGLTAAAWKDSKAKLGVGLRCLFLANIVFSILPSIPGLEFLRDLGLSGAAGLMLWMMSIAALCQRGREWVPSLAAIGLRRREWAPDRRG